MELPYKITLYNTFEQFVYSDRVLFKYTMDDWCYENIGDFGEHWYNSHEIARWRTYEFKRKEDLLAFRLKFSTHD